MDTNVIKECTALSLAEQITFPEVVMKLAQAGVERYIADLVGRQKLSYGAGGGVVRTSIGRGRAGNGD